jgi:hypothetical protein
MRKFYWVIVLTLGLQNFTFSQDQDVDTLTYHPSAAILDLLAKNDSLKLIYEDTKNLLTKEQLTRIFSKAQNKEYNIKQTQVALKLTANLGESWVFSDSIGPENSLNFKSIEEFLEFRNTIPVSSNVAFDDDQSLKRQETIYPNGLKEIIEKDANGNYSKTTITKEGIETVEEIKDISSYNTATMSVQRNNN